MNSGSTVQLSFFTKVKVELKKMFTHAPGWEASASATLTYVAPLVETIVALVDPEAAPIVSALVGKIQSAMAAAAVVVRDAGPAPTLVTYLNGINSDLTQIASLAGIKDASTAQKLTMTVNAITAEVNAILSAVPASQA